ncbi:10372_t:CDS:2 [Cetraspora pellucida]|uniref:10372_t:CDS:1 n=1 Tax=Cetraspora pellucida TaxID=1433469 RepID=A0A9N9DAX8_9GLOM|nr:10372_t:CDS:2 [Cetraspora pellucida]
MRPREFFGTDSKDGIEAILTDHQDYSLHKFIDRDNPLCPIINFDLPREKFDKIEPNSSDSKKMSYHISTFGMHLKNIAKVTVFTKLVHEKLPMGLQDKGITEEHIRVKKALGSKNRNVFDFMLRSPNDEAPVIDSPILDILKEKNRVKDPLQDNKIDAGTIGSEVEYIEKLLEEYKIEGFEVLYSSPTLSNKTYQYYCHRADQEMQIGTKKPSLKLTLNVSVLERENSLPSPEKIEKLDGRLYFAMAPTLDFGKITINIVELRGEPIKLISLIDRIYDTKVIIYDDIDFLPYPPNIEQPKNEFFNLFLGFKAKPALRINYNLVNLIIWHIENI